jgi:hypothetical protein
MKQRRMHLEKPTMKSFLKKPRLSLLWTLAALLLPAAVFADIALPYVFTANTRAVATQVNDNFSALNRGKQDKLTAFVHTVSTANTSGAFSVITNPATDGRPNAILLFSPYLGNALVSYGFARDYALQYYNGHWGITTMDGNPFPLPTLGAGVQPMKFNIVVVQP